MNITNAIIDKFLKREKSENSLKYMLSAYIYIKRKRIRITVTLINMDYMYVYNLARNAKL